jgi:hypothetical protein
MARKGGVHARPRCSTACPSTSCCTSEQTQEKLPARSLNAHWIVPEFIRCAGAQSATMEWMAVRRSTPISPKDRHQGLRVLVGAGRQRVEREFDLACSTLYSAASSRKSKDSAASGSRREKFFHACDCIVPGGGITRYGRRAAVRWKLDVRHSSLRHIWMIKNVVCVGIVVTFKLTDRSFNQMLARSGRGPIIRLTHQ